MIGCGVKSSTSDLLIASCDEFIYYDDLVRVAEKPRKTRVTGKIEAVAEEGRGHRDARRDRPIARARLRPGLGVDGQADDPARTTPASTRSTTATRRSRPCSRTPRPAATSISSSTSAAATTPCEPGPSSRRDAGPRGRTPRSGPEPGPTDPVGALHGPCARQLPREASSDRSNAPVPIPPERDPAQECLSRTWLGGSLERAPGTDGIRVAVREPDVPARKRPGMPHRRCGLGVNGSWERKST